MLTLFFFQNLGLDLHFLIFFPIGVVLGIECQWQHFHVMERIVEDVLEFLQIPCVENPVALAVTGIDACQNGGLVFLKAAFSASVTASISDDVLKSGIPFYRNHISTLFLYGR